MKKSDSDHESEEQSQSNDGDEKRPSDKNSPRPEHLFIQTDIGEVVGGIEAAQRFQHLLAKTLRLKRNH